MIVSPPRIRLAQLPTPLVFLERLTAKMGGPRIYVKRDDLTGSWMTGNKVRKLEFNIAAAIAQGCDTIITCGAVQSNHCRATVFACASLGLKVHLILRGEKPAQPDGNNFLDYVGGAEISYFPRDVYKARLAEIVAELKAAGYTFVALDLSGLKSGSLNQVIPLGRREATPTAE